MPTTLQLRRGTTAENAAFTGAEGELTVDTQTNSLNVHDGSTVGGNAITGGGGSALTTKGDLAAFSTVDARLPVGANDQVLTADSAEATGVKWATPTAGASFTGVFAPYEADAILYGHNVADTDSTTSTQGTANKANYFPMWFLSPVTITELGFACGTPDAGATDTRCAIYSQNATTAMPETLLASTGHIAATATGITTETLGTPLVLAAGIYWFGIKSDSTTLGVASASVTATWGTVLGIARGAGKTRYPYHTGLTGAWPSTAAAVSGTDNVSTVRIAGYL